jgi:hypothetical protein
MFERHSEALRLICQDAPEGRTPRKDPALDASTDLPQRHKPATSGPAAGTVRTRIFAGRPESVRGARAWAASLVPAPAAADVALMVSELVADAIFCTASGLSPAGQVMAGIQVSGDQVRVDIINQPGIAAGASSGLGAGRRIVTALAGEHGFGDLRNWFFLRFGGVS